MKLLLDTHAFIWWDSNDARLSAVARAACLRHGTSLHLSLTSVWEMQIKMQLGKLTLREPLAVILREQLNNGLILEPINLADILALESLPFHHRDPFDRMLVAQAKAGNFTLVTHDTKISDYDVPILW